MAVLLDLLSQYVFSGVPSNAAYDAIKIGYQKATQKSWADLYLDAFEHAVEQLRLQLARYTTDGEPHIDPQALSNVLRRSLNTNIATASFGSLTSDRFVTQLAPAMVAASVLELPGHPLSENDYVQLVRNTVEHARTLFREAVIADENAFRRAVLDEMGDQRALVRQVDDYLRDKFDIVLHLLQSIDQNVRTVIDMLAGNTTLLESISVDVKRGTPQPTETDKFAAQQRLAAMPTDTIPDPAPLPPGSRMRFRASPLFVGRERDLRTLAKSMKDGGTPAIGQSAAVTGMGGLGKTQLAVEFVHRYGQYFQGGVFWLNFDNASAVPAEVAACGGAGGMELHPNFSTLPLEDQLRLVEAAWQSPLLRLLVFDNCEEEALLQKWQPSSGGCHILVTSHRSEWDAALGVQTLPLGVLKHIKSVTLLHEYRSDLLPDNAELHAIAHQLGDLPLALTLAGSFLKQYKRDITPAEYLAELQASSGLKHASLEGEGISPTGHDQSVYRTFKLSYDKLDSSHPTNELALQLLARAAYFAPGEPIPRDLLKATANIFTENQGATRQASKALSCLVNLGLLEEVNDATVRLHRLLAAFVRSETNGAQAQEDVEETMLQIARRVNNQGYPAPLLALQPHLRAITGLALQRKDKRVASLCNEFGYHLDVTGDYPNAQYYYQQALAIHQQIFGTMHTDTANSFNNLGQVLLTRGNLVGAGTCHKQALAIRQHVLGDRHPDTAASLSSIGMVLLAQGDLPNARGYCEEALTICQQVLGDKDLRTAASLNSLGVAYLAQGDLPNARNCHEQALATRQQVLGKQHPHTAVSLNNLGRVLHDQGELPCAKCCFEQALAIDEFVYGSEHPEIAPDLNNLGGVLHAQGDLPGARSCFEQAFIICQQVLGMQHFNTATTINNLALLTFDEGAFDDAVALMRQALAIREQVLGTNHAATRASRQSLAIQEWCVVVVKRAEAAVGRLLVEGNVEGRADLVERLEVAAAAYAAGQTQVSAYLALAARLRALAARLRAA